MNSPNNAEPSPPRQPRPLLFDGQESTCPRPKSYMKRLKDQEQLDVTNRLFYSVKKAQDTKRAKEAAKAMNGSFASGSSRGGSRGSRGQSGLWTSTSGGSPSSFGNNQYQYDPYDDDEDDDPSGVYPRKSVIGHKQLSGLLHRLVDVPKRLVSKHDVHDRFRSEGGTVYLGSLKSQRLPEYDAGDDVHLTMYWARKRVVMDRMTARRGHRS